jgi:TM2 domain-containing membrane protein YozV
MLDIEISLEHTVMQQVNSGTAYVFWCLWFLGIGGAQRLYTGNFASGIIYLFTWGLFGIGQFLDLALIPGMVDRRNASLKGGGNASASVNQSITLNIGDIPQLKQLQTAQSPSTTSNTPMQKLLRAAKENGGQLSLAQAAMHLSDVEKS